VSTRVVVWPVAVLAAGTLVWAIPNAIHFAAHAPNTFWAMAIAALLVDLPLFGALPHDDLRVRSTLSVCFTFAIFVLWGAEPAIIVQAVAGAVTVVGQRYPYRSAVFLVSRWVLATAAADIASAFVGPTPDNPAGTVLDGGDLLAFAVLGAVWFGVSYGLLTAARTLVSPRGMRQAAEEIRFDAFSTITSVALVSPLLITVSGWAVLLIVVPLLVWNTMRREQLRHEARLTREPASGLLNRQGLAVGLRSLWALNSADRSTPHQFGVVVLMAGSLTEINRELGRDLYEKVIIEMSRRLIDTFGQDRVGRVAGDSLVLLVPGLRDEQAEATAAHAARLLTQPIEVEDIPFIITPVAGVALAPKDGDDLSTLLMKAEFAATEARRQSRPALLYVRQTAEVPQRRIAILRELRTALADPARQDELTVLYQPQVDLGTGRLHGVEALVRWTHPDWGLVPTTELIEAIEASEVMHLLTKRVLEVVARQLHDWGEDMRAAVNVSVQDLYEPGFVSGLGRLIRSHAIRPDQLTIEITERMLMTDAPLVQRVCTDLVGLGVGLSLDDFGTGYASLQQLRQLPLSEVKIDRSYIKEIVDQPTDLAIVRSVHDLARVLPVAVVAEGVEDQRTADCLATLPGTIGQGYFFGKPMSPADLARWRQPARQPNRGS
jgi:predicted signal transduction protein with EAL and GGDEF domain